MATWYNEELNPGVLSLNVTMKQLMEKDFIDTIKKTLKEYNFIPTNLKLEITETQMMINAQEIIEKLKKINKLGVKIAIDDFGTGYSNFEYLVKLQADFIKIDGSLIKNVHKNAIHKAVVEAIVTFAQACDAKTIAEFVSSKELFDAVCELGIDYSQGYFIGKPEPQIL